jgi:hypothetical protein
LAPQSNRFDLPAELAVGTRDKDSAWTFIRRFADAWMTPLRDGDGCTQAELNTAEDRLGFTLPTALREAYTLFGNRADLCGTADRLIPLNELYVDDHAGLLIYNVEDQGCWTCGIRLIDLDADDPPTFHVPACSDKECGKGIAWLERLSTACIEVVLAGSPPSTDETLWRRGELLREEIAVLENTFPRLALPPYPIEQRRCTSSEHWYASEDVVLHLSLNPDRDDPSSENEWVDDPWPQRPGSRATLHARGRTAEAADAIREALPKEWFHW